MSKANGRKSIFITGAASGMGRETAKLFAAKGWYVGGYDVNADGLKTLEQEIGFDNCKTGLLDVTLRETFAAALAEFTAETDGKLDILYNNAGIGRGGFFETQSFEDIMAVVNINFVSVLIGIHEGIKYLKATPNSLCFTTSSSSATYGMPGIAVYSATKHAVKGLTEALAVEFKMIGVRAADVLPGLIDTPILPPGVAAAAPKEGMFRAIPAVEVAKVVWEAYHSTKLHWYVPPEIAELDKAATLDPEGTRDAMANGTLFETLNKLLNAVSDDLVGEVAPAQRFDEAKLKTYLETHIDGFGHDLVVQQIKGGASNPTFKLTTQGPEGPLRYVLRKKPPGTLLASAHQVDREYRVMKALQDTGVPVPRMRHLCTDDGVIGTSFYVMDFLDGRIFRDATLPGIAKVGRTAIYDELNATLANLHKVDYEAVGLGDFGRPGGYFERQVARWIKQYRGAESEPIPAMEQLIAELPTLIPPDNSVSIAHGDYRLENVMFHPTEPRLIAVLDWELCTIGHPLADIAYNCFLWHSEAQSWGSLVGVDFAASGIPTESEYRDAYCRRTGRAGIPDWNFYVAFGIFRLASISQGVYRRILSGNASIDRPAINGTPRLAEQALEILHRET